MKYYERLFRLLYKIIGNKMKGLDFKLNTIYFILIFTNTESTLSNSNDELTHCFDDSKMLTLTRCHPELNDSNKDSCGQRYVGKFKLSAASKSMISEYCFNEGEEIRFNNFKNDTKRTFVVTKKFYGFTTKKIKTNVRCPDDESKRIIACADIQMVNVELECKEVNLKFHLDLSRFVYARSDSDKDKFAEKLRIGRKNKKGKIIPDLEVFLNPDTLQFPAPSNQITNLGKSTSGKIINRTYSNAWTYKEDRMTMQYSKLGLIGFQDQNGMFWIRDFDNSVKRSK